MNQSISCTMDYQDKGCVGVVRSLRRIRTAIGAILPLNAVGAMAGGANSTEAVVAITLMDAVNFSPVCLLASHAVSGQHER